MTDWVVDLDGVMWRGRVPIPGSVDAVARLLDRGDRVLFCTNNSAESGGARAERLVEHGLAPGCEVVTSADAVCALVAPGERVLVIGGEGLMGALRQHGARPENAAGIDAGPVVAAASARADGGSSAGPFDCVVVGLTREFDYRQMDVAGAAVRAGARLLASNSDTTFPGSDGLHPGCGSLVAAVEAAAGSLAEVAGKPLEPMAALIRERLGLGSTHQSSDGSVPPAVPVLPNEIARPDVIVVGDRPDTDGQLARRLGVPFALVLSGVTSRGDLPIDVPCAFVADTFADVVHQIDGGMPGGLSLSGG